MVVGYVEHGAEPDLVVGVRRVQAAQPEEAIHLLVRLEVHPAPLDRRAAPQDQTDPLELLQPHLLHAAYGEIR